MLGLYPWLLPLSTSVTRIFLLSYVEAWQYFDSDGARICAPTAYAAGNGTETDGSYRADGRDSGRWWLRSPGYYQGNAAYVHFDGTAKDEGVNDDDVSVRPVFWLELNAVTLVNAGAAGADAAEEANDPPAADPADTCAVGSFILYGSCEQDNDETNGPEPIEWLVLEVDEAGSRALLISRYGLDVQPYNTESAGVTWETCSLRAWLNGDFLSSAFTEAGRAWIPAVINENPDQSLVETPGGRDTEDRVFLLCERDTVIYLNDDYSREVIGRSRASAAAGRDGLETDGDGFASWWLRAPGMYEYIAQFVDREGVPYPNGASTDIDYLCGVRPALWLDAKGGQP